MSEFVALDFETANSSRASACSIGLVVCDEQGILDEAHWLIKPEPCRFNGMNVAIHGITAADVEGEPCFAEIWERVIGFVDGRPLVAHNASFDMSVIRHELARCGLEHPESEYACSVQIARCTWPELPNHKLNNVAAHLGIEFGHHHALEDARACGQIVQYAMREHGETEIIGLAKSLGIRPGKLYPGGYRASSLRR